MEGMCVCCMLVEYKFSCPEVECGRLYLEKKAMATLHKVVQSVNIKIWNQQAFMIALNMAKSTILFDYKR